MIFKDGLRKAGFFENNVYQRPLTGMKEFDDYEKKLNSQAARAREDQAAMNNGK